MLNELLHTDIKFLPGVGPKRAEILNSEIGVYTIWDLLNYFPYRHIDRSKYYKIGQLEAGNVNIQLKGRITKLTAEGKKYKTRLVAKFQDDSGTVDLVWFQGVKWIKDSLKVGTEYVIFGKPTSFNGQINIVHPEVEEPEGAGNKPISSLKSVYSTTEKMKKNFLTSNAINKLQYTALKKVYKVIYESLPNYLLTNLKLPFLNESIKEIHFPSNIDALQKAIFRIKFEELFYIQLQLLKKKYNKNSKLNGFKFPKVGEYLNTFYKTKIPFDLTNAQKKVIKEIRADLASGIQMNRLLQGDVGSGKTLVALMVVLIALDNSFQTCLMAPTEILARQHYASINKFLDGMGLKVACLTGSSRAKERKKIHEQLLSGELDLLIGTHALIEDTVQFKNLGLVIIDEQHRFGVAQRAKLWKKNVSPPHMLVMTATPIPRTLAMTLYGDLDVSVIDELPPGRKPIKTSHLFDSKRSRLFGFLRKEIEKGRQVYIVYPLIQESEKLDYKDLEDGYESIVRAFPAPQYTVSVVHGKMKPDEKDKAMQLFVSGQAQILVSTTVIEVGVDVPNASVMVIESAEKFGLSQLHQLRGRVGRGAEQSWCVLMTSYKLSQDARKRITTMVNSNNGFEIAEADLKLRGPGDIEGTQQSGVAFNLKLANLGKDGHILQLARNKANEILSADKRLENKENTVLLKQLKMRQQQKINWGLIS